jgi:hypothetical protein
MANLDAGLPLRGVVDTQPASIRSRMLIAEWRMMEMFTMELVQQVELALVELVVLSLR